MNRALIFAHYDRDGLVSDAVLYALTAYRQYFTTVYFVTVSDLAHDQVEKLRDVADRVMVRPNRGYDFGSWKEGFARLPDSAQYDEVIFANDSTFGPITDIGQFLSRSEQLGADLWGATVNRQFRPHVQSYFMAFRRVLITSGFARQFWNSVHEVSDKNTLIWQFEVGLSDRVQAAGFKIGAVADLGSVTPAARHRAAADNRLLQERTVATDPRMRHLYEADPSPVQFFWGEGLRLGNPFVKVELLRDNPPGADLQRVSEAIVASKRFDLDFIRSYFERVAPSAAWLAADARSRKRWPRVRKLIEDVQDDLRGRQASARNVFRNEDRRVS